MALNVHSNLNTKKPQRIENQHDEVLFVYYVYIEKNILWKIGSILKI